MKMMFLKSVILIALAIFFVPSFSLAISGIYNVMEEKKAIDSVLKVKEGEKAPDFSLRSIKGATISLQQFKGTHNVVISFVPAAWTPICSDQWPGYNIVEDVFDANNATLIGISVDNIPTLFSWTSQMGELWFHVCSDFYPHGEVAGNYGVLRSDGTAERAIFVVDKEGIVQFAKVYDIGIRPPLEDIVKALESLR